MAKSITYNHTDTTGGATHGITIPSVNFGADFREVSSQKNQEAVISNTTAPLNFPETYRFAANTVNDVYSGTSVDKALYNLSRKGTSFLVQHTEIVTVSDDTDSTYQVALPLEAHIVVKVPQHELVTEEVVTKTICRLFAGLFETDGTTMSSRLKALLRQSLLPKDL